jgi:hypothetical protein
MIIQVFEFIRKMRLEHNNSHNRDCARPIFGN